MTRKNNSIILLTFACVLTLATFLHDCKGEYKTAGHYQPTWNSLGKHQIPEWFKDAKFGIYTHWGPYSVPAYGRNGSWYPHNMYKKGTDQYKYHVQKYGHPSEFGYKDFVPMFKAEKFDADQWAQLFKDAGAKFAGPVAEHHDGFSMWNSKLTKWDAYDKGPKKDIVGQLEKAIRKRGMKFITTFHHATNWAYYPHWVDSFDCSNPEYSDLYGPVHDQDADWPQWYKIGADELAFMQQQPSKEFNQLWLGKLKEVIDNYQPDLIWFDGSLDRMHDNYERNFFVYYFNQAEKWNKDVEVLFKGDDVSPGVATVDFELGRMGHLTRYMWITDTSIDEQGAWSYVQGLSYKSANKLIDNLIDRVSKNGLLLLNVGPKADGTIPEEAKERLLEIGKWLKVNGDAIYGTRAWKIYGEDPTVMEDAGAYSEREGRGRVYTGENIRFTVKDNNLYAICLDWPGDEVIIKSLRRLEEELSIYWTEDDIESIKMLGVEQELHWHFTEQGLHIQTPDKKPCKYAYAFKIIRK